MEPSIGNLCNTQKRTFCHTKAFSADGFVLRPFSIPHDAADPVGYSVSAGVPIVLWSLDSQDWKSHSADAVYQKVLTEVQDGSAILFHDIYDTSVDAAKRLIPALKERGYEMVTVSELAKRKGKTLSPGDVFSKG